MYISFDQFSMNQEILVYNLDYLIAIFTIIIILIIMRKNRNKRIWTRKCIEVRPTNGVYNQLLKYSNRNYCIISKLLHKHCCTGWNSLTCTTLLYNCFSYDVLKRNAHATNFFYCRNKFQEIFCVLVTQVVVAWNIFMK